MIVTASMLHTIYLYVICVCLCCHVTYHVMSRVTAYLFVLSCHMQSLEEIEKLMVDESLSPFDRASLLLK